MKLRTRIGSLAVAGALFALALPALAQESYAPHDYRGRPPVLSEATAILEAAVRNMYTNIEPGSDSSPNELLAYADLRSLRLYTGALEVAGWSLEQAVNDFHRYQRSGAYRNGYGKITDPRAEIALERYRAYRETTRTLLFRVRTTAVAVEHQVGICGPEVSREWRSDVLPALRDVIAATEPMFEEQLVYQRYGVPGKTVASNKVVQTSNSGIPQDAVEVSRRTAYKPYNGEGRGTGKYFEIRAFGGPVRVTAVRFRCHENSFGSIETSNFREVTANQIAEPGRPIYVACNRGRACDLSELEVEWEATDRNRRSYAIIELVENNGTDRR